MHQCCAALRSAVVPAVRSEGPAGSAGLIVLSRFVSVTNREAHRGVKSVSPRLHGLAGVCSSSRLPKL